MTDLFAPGHDKAAKKAAQAGEAVVMSKDEIAELEGRELSGMAATSEVADQLDADRNSIYKKLTMMQDDDEVDSRMAGGIRVWSVKEENDA